MVDNGPARSSSPLTPLRNRPAGVTMTDGEVHIWCVEHGRWSAKQIEQLQVVLSHDERERAGRMRRPEDRARYAVARAVLRRLIAEYLEYPSAHALQLAYRSFG